MVVLAGKSAGPLPFRILYAESGVAAWDWTAISYFALAGSDARPTVGNQLTLSTHVLLRCDRREHGYRIQECRARTRWWVVESERNVLRK